MKLRVLGLLSALLALLVALASITLMLAASRDATRELQINRVASLNRFVELAAEAETNGSADQLEAEMRRYSELYDEGVLVRIGDRSLTSGDLVRGGGELDDTLRRAAMNLPRTELPLVTPWSSAHEFVARPFGTSGQVLGAVVLEVDTGEARADVLQRWLAIIGVAVVSGTVLLLLAWRLTLWILRPIGELRAAVHDFAQTEQARVLDEAGPPELRQLQRAFSAMSTTVTESLEQQRQLIAETSHQLRNPIGALRLRIDTLALVGDEAREHALHTVQQELARVEDLLAAVLRVASAEHRASERSAHGPADTAAILLLPVIDPVDVVAEELQRLAPLIAQHAAPVRVTGPDRDDVAVRCHRSDFGQIVAELVENALKYAPGAPIDIRIDASGGRATLTVRDHGEGLAADEIDRAGARFWRSTKHRALDGTGLGLTIVSRLAEANAGRFSVRAADGGGLVAALELPCRPEHEVPA